MSNSNLPGVIGVIIGSVFAPKFIQKFISPEAIENKWITPFKEAAPRPKPITQNAWPVGLLYTWALAAILVMPILILYFYPSVQLLLFDADASKFFRNNGQFLIVIVWIFSGPLLFVLIADIFIHPFEKWRNRIYAHRLEENLIAVKKLKPQIGRQANNKQLEKIAGEYDLKRMSLSEIRRFFVINVILFTLLSPLYTMGLFSYTRITKDVIAIAPTLGYIEQTYSWQDLSSIEIYIEGGEHITPHFDLVFQNGKVVNIWDLSLPLQSTEDLIFIRELAEEKGVLVNIGFMYQDLSGLRESSRIQIQEVMDIKTGINDYIEEGSAL